jgi:hypothetical protein
MDQDTMLTTLVPIKAGPVIRIRRVDQGATGWHTVNFTVTER